VLIMEVAAPPLLGSLEGGAEPHTPLPRLPLLLPLLLELQPKPWGLRQVALLVLLPPALLLLLVRRTVKVSPLLLTLPMLLGLLVILSVLLLRMLLLPLLLL
jgi:hypothetical protein